VILAMFFGSFFSGGLEPLSLPAHLFIFGVVYKQCES
jgi:hypothetical protein